MTDNRITISNEEKELLQNFATEQGIEKAEDTSDADYYKLLAEKAEEFAKSNNEPEQDEYALNMQRRAIKALKKSVPEPKSETVKAGITYEDLSRDEWKLLADNGLSGDSKETDIIMKLVNSGLYSSVTDALQSPAYQAEVKALEEKAKSDSLLEGEGDFIQKTKQEMYNEFKEKQKLPDSEEGIEYIAKEFAKNIG